jgi:hypothetical protein
LRARRATFLDRASRVFDPLPLRIVPGGSETAPYLDPALPILLPS